MLYYGLVCTAIDEDRQRLREGMCLLANIAHKYKIPISWAITADIAQFFKKELTEWHHEYGDEPLLMLDITSLWKEGWYAITEQPESGTDIERGNINSLYVNASENTIAEHLVRMRGNVPRYIRSEWKKLERSLDWAVPNIAGAEWKNHVLVHALEQVGFRGLWGYRWDERDSIAEVDRGCPFGFFYPSKEQHNFSTPAAGSIAGIPYNTASHILKEEHNLRSSLINNISQQHFDLYAGNNQWNRWLSFVEHFDAMEVIELGQETLAMLDAYFEHITNNDSTKFLPLSEIVDDYWANCQMTEPTFFVETSVVANAETESNDPHNADSESGKKLEFSYYDSECQCFFVEDALGPVEMKNYISPPVIENLYLDVSEHSYSNHGIEFHLPKVTNYQPIRKRTRLHINFTIESTKSMPYAVVIWGNHLGLHLEKSNAKEVTWVDKYLLFIRLDLEKGDNDFEVVLSI